MIASRSGALRIIHARAADWMITTADRTIMSAGPSPIRLVDIPHPHPLPIVMLPPGRAANNRQFVKPEFLAPGCVPAHTGPATRTLPLR